MVDILVYNNPYQSSSAPTFFFDQLVWPNQYQSTSQACLTDLTPPTFAGIAGLVVQSRGQLRATWLAGTDATAPVRYEIYVKAGSPTGIFSSANLIALTDKLLYEIFTMPDGSFLQNGQTYYVGVRAIDGVGNRDGNTTVLSVISTGVIIYTDTYNPEGAFVVNSSNQFQGTLWITKNSVLSADVVLGFASYQVYDKTGAAIVGMSETNISADSNGQFKITPVASLLNQSLEHYIVKVTIKADGADRSDFVPLIQKAPTYDISGLFFVNSANRFDGTFWVTANEQQKTTGLGNGSYQVYDSNGTAVVGMSQTGIVPDVNGIYAITDIASLLSDGAPGYSVKVTLIVDGVSRSEMFAVQSKTTQYEARGQFSINALNQFKATFWVVESGMVKTGASLGVANYTVYDAAGAAVSGLTESGISPDVNGRYQIAAVSAALLSDLTHYSVKIGIVVDGIERISYRGFTLLGN